MPGKVVEGRMFPEDGLGTVGKMVMAERGGRHGLEHGFPRLSGNLVFDEQGRTVAEALQVVALFLGAVPGHGQDSYRLLVKRAEVIRKRLDIQGGHAFNCSRNKDGLGGGIEGAKSRLRHFNGNCFGSFAEK